MSLTGKDVWDAIVKLGLMSGPYDPRTNRSCANAHNISRLLNEVLTKGQSWLPNLVETEDAMRVWEANTHHEYRAEALQIPQYDGLDGGRDRGRD